MPLPDSGQVFYGKAFDVATAAASTLHILDVGCGRGVHALNDRTGRAFYELARDRHVLWGTDPDPVGADHPMLHRFVRSTGTELPFETASIDLIVSDWVMEHVADPEAFAAELVRVARPGARVLYRTMQRWSPAGIGARLVPNRFHPALIKVLQPGMNAVDVYPTTVRANTVPATRQLFAPYASHLDMVRCAGLSGYVPNRPLAAVTARIETLAPGWFAHGLVVDITLRT
jgi:hypothetical protein